MNKALTQMTPILPKTWVPDQLVRDWNDRKKSELLWDHEIDYNPPANAGKRTPVTRDNDERPAERESKRFKKPRRDRDKSEHKTARQSSHSERRDKKSHSKGRAPKSQSMLAKKAAIPRDR